MAHDDSKAMALADVYAESLVRAAGERDQDEAVAEEFVDLVRFMDEHPEFDELLTAESVDDDPRRETLEKLFRGRMNDLLLNLLQVLNNRARCRLIRNVQRCVRLRMEAKRQQQEVVVRTAMPLTDDLRAAVREAVGARIGKEVLLVEEVEPELIGGLVIRFGDVQVDGSVTSRVRSMYKRMVERAAAEMQRGGSYSIDA